jgi:hypothetical protein
MTLVKVLNRAVVYPDGIRPVTYEAGDEVAVTDIALAQLIEQGACEIVENKAIEAAPETKPVRGRKRAPKV